MIRLALAIGVAAGLASLVVACAAPAPQFHLAGIYRCGPELMLDAWQAGESLRLETVERSFELNRTRAASGVRWEGDGVVFHEKGEQAVFARDGETQQCRLDESLMRAIERGVDYRAVGQEPGWLLNLFDGERMVLEYDYAQQTATLPYVEPEKEAGGKTFVTKANGERLEVHIAVAPCRDAMSGQPYPDTVTVRYRNADTERILEGCGRPLPK